MSHLWQTVSPEGWRLSLLRVIAGDEDVSTVFDNAALDAIRRRRGLLGICGQEIEGAVRERARGLPDDPEARFAIGIRCAAEFAAENVGSVELGKPLIEGCGPVMWWDEARENGWRRR